MDPNANLEEQRKLAAHIIRTVDTAGGDEFDLTEEAERLAELVQALDEWLAGGGFLPEPWRPQ